MFKKTYIITGGNGFIGTNFLSEITKNKKIRIINIDKISNVSNNKFNVKKSSNYIYFKENLLNYKKIENIILNFKPEKILHLAAESHVDRSIDNPADFISENIKCTLNLLSASLKYYNSYSRILKKFNFIYVGTDEIYGDLNIKSKKRFNEKSCIKPNNPYSASKASCFHIVRSYNKTFNLPVSYINFCNNFGEFQHPEKLIPKTILSLANKKPITIYGKGENIRNWIYVKQAVKQTINVIKNSKNNRIYNISSNFEISNLRLVNLIIKNFYKIKKIKKNYKIQFAQDRPGHDKRYSLRSNIIKEKNVKKVNSLKNFELDLKRVILWYLKKDNLNYFVNLNSIYKRLGIFK